MDTVPMTQEGLEKLTAELKELEERRPKIQLQIKEAREKGDLSENAEYHAAREKQSFIEGRIIELEDVVSRADVIDPSKLSGTTVRFGDLFDHGIALNRLQLMQFFLERLQALRCHRNFFDHAAPSRPLKNRNAHAGLARAS